jgi:hypothetical protein
MTQSPVILFAAKSERWDQYETPLRTGAGRRGLGHAR